MTTNAAGTWTVTLSLFAVVGLLAVAFAAGVLFARLTASRIAPDDAEWLDDAT